MPITGFKPKLPALSVDEVERLKRQFVGEVERELVIRGMSNAETSRLVQEMPPRLIVTPRYSGVHEVRYSSRDGRNLSAPLAANYIAHAASARVALLAFGPDPVELLIDRLVALGVSREEARSRAGGRVARLHDGRVTAFGAGGRMLYNGGPEPRNDREYTPDELAGFRDPNEALTRATRAILDELKQATRVVTVSVDRVAAIRGAF